MCLTLTAAALAMLSGMTGCSDVSVDRVLYVDDVNRYLNATDEKSVICIGSGFDSICIKVGRGPKGERGPQGPSGEPGRDGAFIVMETLYLLLQTPSDSFVLELSEDIPEDTPTTYITPVATVEVPAGGGTIVVTEADEDEPVTVIPVPQPPRNPPPQNPPPQNPPPQNPPLHDSPPTQDSPPEEDLPDSEDEDEVIYHVKYKIDDDESRQVYYYVYKRGESSGTSDEGYESEIQGTLMSVNGIISSQFHRDGIDWKNAEEHEDSEYPGLVTLPQ